MQTEPSLVEKLHSETAKISWHDLQPYFANGSLLAVDQTLDLVAVAVDVAQDSSDKLKNKIESKLICAPSNDQARSWYAADVDFWAVVVAPFVLVQLVETSSHNNNIVE